LVEETEVSGKTTDMPLVTHKLYHMIWTFPLYDIQHVFFKYIYVSVIVELVINCH
jgi:hypothetical protein